MGLNIKSFSIERELLGIKLSQLGESSSRQILAVMREEAQKIAELAKRNAPIEDGYLEDAIKVEEDRGGMNGRTRVYVHVDPKAVDDRGQQVWKYAKLQNELLGPFGSGFWNLGPLSRNKDSGRGVVGGKFIDRAVIARRSIIGRKINEIARKVFK